MRTKRMVTAALLIALGVVIPTISVPIIPDPAVSATFASHVPVIVAMFISPSVAILTALGTTLGFLLKGLPIVVWMRALSHLVFAAVGSIMLIKVKNKPLKAVWTQIFAVYFVTMLLHTGFELLIIRIFTPDAVHMMVGAGIFLLHHTVDFLFSLLIIRALKSVKGIDIFENQKS
jgi:niacin transporter